MFPKYCYNDTTFDNRFDLFAGLIQEGVIETCNLEGNYRELYKKIKCTLDVFGDYEFKRNKNVDLFALAKERLLELKATGKKIHFWYSGGMDSHFVLYCMKKFDIWPDTINTYIIDPSDKSLDIFHRREGTPAIEFLDDFGVPVSVERKVWDIGSEIFTKTLQLPEFTKYSSIFGYSHIFVTNFFYKVIPDFPVGENHMHLKGAVTPIIFFDKKWQFTYCDYQFEGVVYGHSEYFIDASPKFLEAYVNSIINVLEKKYKIGLDLTGLLLRDNDRYLKKQCPEINLAYEGINWVQYEKHVKTPLQIGVGVVDLILRKSQVKAHDIYHKCYLAQYNWINEYNARVIDCADIITYDINMGGLYTEIIKLK